MALEHKEIFHLFKHIIAAVNFIGIKNEKSNKHKHSQKCMKCLRKFECICIRIQIKKSTNKQTNKKT